MHTQNIRISRVTQPRGTLFAMVLLDIVFLSFGVVAEACSGDDAAADQVISADHGQLLEHPGN